MPPSRKNGLRRRGTINGNWAMKGSGLSTIPTFGPILCTGFRRAATLVTIGFQPSRIKRASCAGMTDGTGTTAGKETILSTQLFTFKFQYVGRKTLLPAQIRPVRAV